MIISLGLKLCNNLSMYSVEPCATKNSPVEISKKDIPLSKRDNCIPDYSLDELRNKLDKLEKLRKKYNIKISYFPGYLKINFI